MPGPLAPTPRSSPAPELARADHKVPDSADPRQLCRCQLVASARAPGGEMLDCTGVQAGPAPGFAPSGAPRARAGAMFLSVSVPPGEERGGGPAPEPSQPRRNRTAGAVAQVGALLDDLFAYAGSLGCNPTDGSTPQSGVTLALWAPTAQIVEALESAKGRGSTTGGVERLRAPNVSLRRSVSL